MNELNKASEVLSKIHNPRVIYLPPMTMATIYLPGDSVEEALRVINDFAKQNNLFKAKPDLRLFISEHAHGHECGNEVLVSIPDDFDVPVPLVKKKFHGGQYAAHILGENEGFSTYKELRAWINNGGKFQYDHSSRREPSTGEMSPDFEEVINYYNQQIPSINQIDVLMPVIPM